MTIGLFIGRFQPFHNGHLHVTKQILSECSEIIIGIGSANAEKSENNPLSAGEREEMLKKVMEAEAIMNYRIVLINDKSNHEEWIQEVKLKAAPFDCFYLPTGKEIQPALLSSSFQIKHFNTLHGISSGKIRELKKNNQEWKHLVPKPVALIFNSQTF